MSITSFFRPLIVALLLFEGGLQAQPLVETYKRQEELRLRVAEICQSQFQKAQYLPVEGQQDDLRFMISAKGVQAIKSGVVSSQAGGSYECDRGSLWFNGASYGRPMLLGRTYTTSVLPFTRSSRRIVRRERLELEPCAVLDTPEARGESYTTIETSCLISYTQFGDSLVDKRTLAYRRRPQSE